MSFSELFLLSPSYLCRGGRKSLFGFICWQKPPHTMLNMNTNIYCGFMCWSTLTWSLVCVNIVRCTVFSKLLFPHVVLSSTFLFRLHFRCIYSWIHTDIHMHTIYFTLLLQFWHIYALYIISWFIFVCACLLCVNVGAVHTSWIVKGPYWYFLFCACFTPLTLCRNSLENSCVQWWWIIVCTSTSIWW